MRAPMREFLEWVASGGRTRAEAMEAWRSHCPRFTLWEDALIEGFTALGEEGGVCTVRLTEKGRRALEGEQPPN